MPSTMLPPATATKPLPPASGRQPLNPLDVALWCVDQTIRGMGYPGFETQMLVWLEGRLDTPRLARGMARLARRHPATMARLVEDPVAGRSTLAWQFQSDTRPRLESIQLVSDEPQAVLETAAETLSRPHDPARSPPLRFQVLHRPGGRDVLLLQYSHVLMDNGAALPLVKELDRLCQSGDELDDAPLGEPRGLVSRHLRKRSRAQRRQAARAAIELQGHALRGRAAILGTGEEDKPRQVRLRIAARTIDSDLARAIQARSVALCGLSSLSMAILASAFRAVRHFGPASSNARRNYMAGIGLDLNLRRGSGALLQNLASLMPIAARPDDLTDRDGLVRLLSRQMRERLESNIDLGIVRLVRVFQRRPRHIRWVVEHLLRWSYSLWYAHFGALDGVTRLCDVPVEKIQYVGPTWSPVGFSLLSNQYGGRLLLQATYDPDLLPGPLAENVLDWIVADLADFATVPARPEV